MQQQERASADKPPPGMGSLVARQPMLTMGILAVSVIGWVLRPGLDCG